MAKTHFKTIPGILLLTGCFLLFAFASNENAAIGSSTTGTSDPCPEGDRHICYQLNGYKEYRGPLHPVIKF